jgi:hypothetical protein
MNFSRNGDWYQVSRITGPSHNFLGLKFGESSASPPVVEFSSVGTGAEEIEADDVQRQVLEGLYEANAQLGTAYHIAAIRFVTTDTPSLSIYRSLTRSLIEWLARENAF